MDSFVILDTETTGVDPSRDRIIEIAAVRWCDFKIVDQFSSLVNPHCPLPSEITMLTGIRQEDLDPAPSFAEIHEKIVSFIGEDPVVGHNIAFDTAFLRSHHLSLKNASIDTLTLAKILLRCESSYALEVLMKKYGLPSRSSHRALEDVLTTASFFEFLIGKISEIPPDVFQELEVVLKKTNWAGASVFSLRGDNKIPLSPPVKGVTKKESSKAIAPWSDDLTRQCKAGSHILLESPRSIAVNALKKTPTIIAYASRRVKHECMQQGNGLKIAELKEPHMYLAPKKLATLCAQAHIPSDQAAFVLKMLLWSHETSIGDREEIAFDRDEYGMFETVADREGEGVHWKKSLSEAADADIVLIHQCGLANGLSEKLNAAAGIRFKHLIITEAARLEENFTHALKKRHTETSLRPLFGDKATIAWGLLGIFYERFSDPEKRGAFGNVVITPELRQSIEWKRAMEALANLRDHPCKEEILRDLSEAPGAIAWITSFAEEIIYMRAPVPLNEIFQKNCAGFESVLLHSTALSGDGTFKFVKGMFGLDEKWKEVREATHAGATAGRDAAGQAGHRAPAQEPPRGGTRRGGQGTGKGNLEIIIPKDFPEPFTNGYFNRCTALFSEIIKSHKGRVLFLLGSKKMVESIYAALLPRAGDTRLLAVGPSGGVGKSVALFREAPESSVLFATAQIIPFLEEIEDSLEVAVFQKIPFDPPDDPLLRARGAQFEDAFMDYTLPRAIIKFRELLAELGRGSMKKCYILDSRIHTRAYGSFFIETC